MFDIYLSSHTHGRSVRCEFVERSLTLTARRPRHRMHACITIAVPGLKEKFPRREHKKRVSRCSKVLPSRYQPLCLAGLVWCGAAHLIKFYKPRSSGSTPCCRSHSGQGQGMRSACFPLEIHLPNKQRPLQRLRARKRIVHVVVGSCCCTATGGRPPIRYRTTSNLSRT